MGYNLKIYLMQGGGEGRGIDFLWERIFLAVGGMSKFLVGGGGLPSSPSRENPDLHSSLRFF